MPCHPVLAVDALSSVAAAVIAVRTEANAHQLCHGSFALISVIIHDWPYKARDRKFLGPTGGSRVWSLSCWHAGADTVH